QVDRSWFLSLVDASLLARYPERNGRLPGDGLEDAPLRRVWNELAEEWLARVEQLPPALRGRLGRLNEADWRKQRDLLTQQGVDARVVEQLVTASAQPLLPGVAMGAKPPEPYRQLWFAAAMRSLDDVRIETLVAKPQQTVLSSRVQAGGARLITIKVPQGRRLVLGINGTPLMQMTVFGAKGEVVAERGPLRVVSLPADAGTPVQVLVTNEGVSSGVLTLSCRADRPVPRQLPPVEPNPLPDPATGAREPVQDQPDPRPSGVPDRGSGNEAPQGSERDAAGSSSGDAPAAR
ncbi:MAG: serine/threonine protein kinase, partial [Synechococcus sp.]|nr:serine/threonine protein kinase [Synechococcus sp.]